MSIIVRGKSVLGPNVVTDGLVLYLDAGNVKSYPGTGTVWSDLSGDGNNGDLINGITYSSGNLLFDGSIDYVDCGTKASLDITPNVTLETFVNFPSFTVYGGFIAKRTEGPALGNYYFRTANGIGQFQLGHNPGSHQIWITNKTDFAINTCYT